MARGTKIRRLSQFAMCRTLYFWPLIVAGGRFAVRIVLNLWNLIEPGGADIQ